MHTHFPFFAEEADLAGDASTGDVEVRSCHEDRLLREDRRLRTLPPKGAWAGGFELRFSLTS
jgi:hypothetical protein